jgi:hypothetical protein
VLAIEETRIVLDCAFDKIELILSQANEIKLLTDYHNYLITRDANNLSIIAFRFV